jgi:hypothetical protein
MTWWVAFDYYGQDYYNAMGVYNHDRTWQAPMHASMQAAYATYTSTNL